MKRIFLGLLMLVQACGTDNSHDLEIMDEAINQPIAIVLHGGAGTILKENLSPELEQAYLQILDSAITKGYAMLQEGVPAADAVVAVIMILEDSPLFNAGKGAVFTHEGRNELDASFMDGATLNAGAVAGVTTVKNPIVLARAVMEKSPHVMMTGAGAERFAAEQGIELVDPSYFFVQSRFDALQRIKNEEKTQLDHDDKQPRDAKFGTVGCVALDAHGNIVAGTSTGGMTNKRWNRIGDSPIIGAGTYANNKTCGVSATGWGEFFIRAVVAYDISALMEYKGLSLKEAAELVILEKLPVLGGDGGVVALDANGNVAMVFNTAGMYRASIDRSGSKTVAIYNK
jgi:beta-aspartyl-peptidase (threonine type)